VPFLLPFADNAANPAGISDGHCYLFVYQHFFIERRRDFGIHLIAFAARSASLPRGGLVGAMEDLRLVANSERPDPDRIMSVSSGEDPTKF
jgi:hypothetical protein